MIPPFFAGFCWVSSVFNMEKAVKRAFKDFEGNFVNFDSLSWAHDRKHFTSNAICSFFTLPPSQVVVLLQQTLKYPDETFEVDNNKNKKNPKWVYLKAFNTSVGFCNRAQRSCNSLRIVVEEDQRGDFFVVSAYPFELLP